MVKRGAKCKSCKLASNSSTITSNEVTVTTAGGTCKSNNLIYGLTCRLCTKNNVYVGKTVQAMSDRISGHRKSFYNLLTPDTSSSSEIKIDDSNILGHHIISCHGKTMRTDFDKCYMFDIISTANPLNIRILEQFFIDKLKTRIPFGLNQIDSIF